MITLHECIDKLASEDEADRMYAAEDIGYANQADGIPPLLARLPEETSRAVREAIFGALLRIEDDGVIEGAVGLLDSEDSFLRNQAVEILRARGARTIPYLNNAFRDENNDRRKFLIDVLARLGDAGSEIYGCALKSPDLNVVITAVESLGNARQTQFREQIEELVVAEAHPMLLCACLEALAEIGEWESVDIVRRRLGPVAPAPGYLRPSYLKLLGARGRIEVVAEVAETMSGEGLEEPVLNALTALRNRYPALKLPASLAGLLENIAARKGSPLMGYEAIRLLATLLQEPGVFDFVEHRMSDPEKSIRMGAGQAMREGGSEKAMAVLARYSGDLTRLRTFSQPLPLYSELPSLYTGRFRSSGDGVPVCSHNAGLETVRAVVTQWSRTADITISTPEGTVPLSKDSLAILVREVLIDSQPDNGTWVTVMVPSESR